MPNILDYYEANAAAYAARTQAVDMSQFRTRFTELLSQDAHILDVGCGSGRDTLAFARDGFCVTAFDGSAELVLKARELTQQHVLHLEYAQVNLSEQFDGVWACSSLLHLENEELNAILEKLFTSLKPDGVLFTCFKQGSGYRHDAMGRFFNDFSIERLQTLSAFKNNQQLSSWVTGSIVDPDTLFLNILYRKSS